MLLSQLSAAGRRGVAQRPCLCLPKDAGSENRAFQIRPQNRRNAEPPEPAQSATEGLIKSLGGETCDWRLRTASAGLGAPWSVSGFLRPGS